MKTGTLVAAIAIVAVIAMFIWNFVAPGGPSWIVFLFAGLAIVIVCGIKAKDKGK